jgi:hypothetical protein
VELLSALICLGGGKPDLPRPKRIEHPDRPEPKREKPKVTTDVSEIASFFGLKERR